MSDRVYVNRSGDKVWSPNTKEQLCEAIEELTAQNAILRALYADASKRYGKKAS